ncbi:MAG TPA: hypothetical protein VGW33_02645 [Terriglobia bacterium]|nr:hypothetical protein [Terriglobia bacterium]
MATASVALPRRRPRPGPVGARAKAPELCYVKAIDNSRLQRVVDPKKWRECLGLMGLASLVFSVLLLYAWQHFQCVRYGYEIEQLKTRQAGLEQWNQRLRFEEASLESRQRISELAGEKLGLRPRDPQQVIPLDGSAPVPPPADGPVFARNNKGTEGEADGGLAGDPTPER